MGQRANENTEGAIKAREAAAFLAEWMNNETLRKEEVDDQGQASESEEEESEDEDGFVKTNRNGIGMQDILDATAKLPTQKQADELVAGAQQIIYTEEQKADIAKIWKE